jgi:hypothetical protein
VSAAGKPAIKQQDAAKPTVKQHLAAIRKLFDWLIIGTHSPAIIGAVPARNEAERIERCLAALANQRYLNGTPFPKARLPRVPRDRASPRILRPVAMLENARANARTKSTHDQALRPHRRRDHARRGRVDYHRDRISIQPDSSSQK